MFPIKAALFAFLALRCADGLVIGRDATNPDPIAYGSGGIANIPRSEDNAFEKRGEGTLLWQNSAHQHIQHNAKDPDKTVKNAERVAKQGLAQDGALGNDAALRAGPHKTPSAPHGQDVVTVAESKPGSDESVTHHYPVKYDRGGHASLDTSLPDHKFTNPNTGGNMVPQTPGRQGKPFKRAIEVIS